MERALKHYMEAWYEIKQGNFFDENTNTIFDYTIKSLWNTAYKKSLKIDILNHFPAIYTRAKDLPRPPPLFYILISLRDPDIIKEMQSLLIIDWIKSNASEESTFQLLNFIETFDEKQIDIDNFVNTIINRISSSLQADMVEALAHMITIKHPEFMRKFLLKFLNMADRDDTLLKNYVRMVGRKALLELTQISTPEQLNKVFKQFSR